MTDDSRVRTLTMYVCPKCPHVGNPPACVHAAEAEGPIKFTETAPVVEALREIADHNVRSREYRDGLRLTPYEIIRDKARALLAELSPEGEE